MPSGSKKRKAAKKKKEKEASHIENHNQQPRSAASQPHDNGDSKHPYDKESEGEEVSSPASQDHPNHQHQFNDGEKEDVKKTEDSSHVQLSSEESKSTEEHRDNGGVVEKEVVEESVVYIERELNPAGELNAERVEPQKESGEVVVSQCVDEESVTEAVHSHFEGPSQVPNPVPVGEVYGSVVEYVSDDAGSSGKKSNIHNNNLGDSFTTSDVVILGVVENGKKEVSSLDQNGISLPILVDLGLEKRKDEPIGRNDAPGALGAKNSLTPETEERLMLSYSAPRDEATDYVNTSNVADHLIDCNVHESSDTQPLVASAARPVQRTSLMSCCGLFEVLSGSNR